MIEVYKILTNRYNVGNVNLHLQQLQSNITKSHKLKLVNIPDVILTYENIHLLFEL